jgi:hypothetical protein
MPSESALRLRGDLSGKDVLAWGRGGGPAGVFLATRGARVTALKKTVPSCASDLLMWTGGRRRCRGGSAPARRGL